MAAHENGYVKLTTLVSVLLPTLTLACAAVGLFVVLSINPVQKDIDALKQDNRDIHGDLVPRKEHDRFDAQLQQQMSGLQRQIDENRSDLHAVYTPGDAIKRMEERLEKLEERQPSPK